MEFSWKVQPNSGIVVESENIKVDDLKGSKTIAVYSNKSINTNTHKNDAIRWSIRVLKNSKPAGIALVNSCKYVNDTFLKNDNIFYGISCQTGDKIKNDSNGRVPWTSFSNKQFKINALMTIELNIPLQTMSIYHNNKFVGVAFENVDTNNIDYYLGVSMSGVNDEMIFEKMEIIPSAQAPRNRVFKKYDEFENELIDCNKVKTVIGSDDIVNLSLKLLNIGKTITLEKRDSENKEMTPDNTHKNNIEGRLIEWLFPTPPDIPIDTPHQNFSFPKQQQSKSNAYDLVRDLNEVSEWINSTKSIESKTDSALLESFVDNYQPILEQLHMQKNRIKQTSQKIKTIFRTKSSHSGNIKELEKELNKTTTESSSFAQSAERSFEKLNEIKQEMKQNYNKYQELMTTREKSLKNCVLLQNEINTTENRLAAEKNKFNQCGTLLEKYRIFKQDTKKVDEAMNQLFNAKFDEFESKWLEWDEKQIVFWFKYTLKCFEESIKDKDSNNGNDTTEDSKEHEVESDEVLSIDFDKILFNLQTQKIRGINNLGFQLMKHQLNIHNAIRNLIEKYPVPQEDDVDDGIEGQVMHGTSETTDDKEIDKKYLCPLSRQLMKNPVIATDGVTYERSALEEYSRKYKKLPDSDVTVDDIDQEMQSWFVDDDLKEEIDKLVQ